MFIARTILSLGLVLAITSGQHPNRLRNNNNRNRIREQSITRKPTNRNRYSMTTPPTAAILSTTSTTSSSSIMVDAAPAEQYVCDSADKLITDIWTINNILYINILHYKDDSTNSIDNRIFEFDTQRSLFTNVFHFPTMAPLYADAGFGNSYLKDIMGKALSKSNHSNNIAETPSILYFSTRNALRYGCQQKWLYIPPTSQFCRFHPIVNYLFRVVAIIDPTTQSTSPSNRLDIDIYRMISIRSDDFSMSVVRPIFSSIRNDHKRDVLDQYIQNSLLTLQLHHQIQSPLTGTTNNNVRFIFSNGLGLFIAWYPSTMQTFDTDITMNCAIMIPIKNKPYLQLCSQRYNFLTFIELNETLSIILPDNLVINLELDYIRKQYRIMNNLQINLDQWKPENFFQTFFHCKRSPPSNRLSLQYYGYNKKHFGRQNPNDNVTTIVDNEDDNDNGDNDDDDPKMMNNKIQEKLQNFDNNNYYDDPILDYR